MKFDPKIIQPYETVTIAKVMVIPGAMWTHNVNELLCDNIRS